MLFSFPSEALDCNWLNDTVIEVLISGLDAIDVGGRPVAWPDCIPGDRRQILRRRSGLKRNLLGFWEVYSGLNAASRQAVRHSISRQTALPMILSDTNPCPVKSQLPREIRESAGVLGDYLFDQLKKIIEDDKCIRDVHYEKIQNSGVRICPFCGLNYFRPFGERRNALDHFMPISHYPFVAADLRNLPPACHDCNSLYKGAVDILLDAAGVRRVASDPYSGPTYIVSLKGSTLGDGNFIRGRRMPKWVISFLGDPAPQGNTWDSVYHIKSRYESALDADFESWIKHFATWFVREYGRDHSADSIAQKIPRYISNVLQESIADRAFLKVEVFKVVQRACSDHEDGEDTREWLRGFVEYST